jgi:uncharacterized metal-binding protein YceD (DUF177 family)
MSQPEKFEIAGAALDINKVPANGRTLRISVSSDQLEEIAAIARVSALNTLQADLLVEAHPGGVRVTGRLRAEAVQPCVVTLEALVQTIDEPLERIFLSGRDENDEAGAGSVRFVDLEPEAMPDYFEGQELDLSNYLLEVLGLAIELYPRAPGVEMAPEQKGDDPALLSPFAALKERRGGSKKDQ